MASISGVAGTGAPMAGATVTITCVAGSATATTSDTGAFTATFSSAPTAPCAIKAEGIDGTGERIVHYAVLDEVDAAASNRANVNPATTVIAGAVLSGDPEAFFEDAQANLGQITPQKVQQAVTQIQIVIGNVDPIKDVYVADKVDALDQKFDQLKIEWNPDSSSFTVTSKVTGTVIGSVSTTNFDGDKAAFESRMEDPDIVPTSGPNFAALDTQFGASITAALAASSKEPLYGLFDGSFVDGGLSRAFFVDTIWDESQGGTVGKFTVIGCRPLPSDDTVSADYQGKHVCRVAASMTLDGATEPFELTVIEKTAGHWLAFGDQMNHRIEITPTMQRSRRIDSSTADSYRTGLQVWIPVPEGDNADDFEALPNADIARVEVKLGDSLLATLERCGNASYLQKRMTGSGQCAGNLYDMPDADINKLIDAYNDTKAAPVLTVTLYDDGGEVLDSYAIKLETLPVTKAAIKAEGSVYQKRFPLLDPASVTALQSLGANTGTVTLSWTSLSRVEDVNWYAESMTGMVSGYENDITGTAVSFSAQAIGQTSYTSSHLSARGSDGRHYWSKYFGCGGNACQ